MAVLMVVWMEKDLVESMVDAMVVATVVKLVYYLAEEMVAMKDLRQAALKAHVLVAWKVALRVY